MLQLIKFFTRNRIGLLFLFLELVAFVFIIKSHSYHHSKYLNSANAITGSILKKTNSIGEYFKLSKHNKLLVKENELLKNQIEKNGFIQENKEISKPPKYQYISAKVVNNPYSKRNNILTIDKGLKDSIKPNMGVVLSNGIVGITLNTSNNFSTILSLLNSQTKINAKMKKSHHYGSIEWNGDDFAYVQLLDLPIQANIQKGDTIVSGGKSIIFPEGIPIGSIESFEIKDKAYQKISIKLFADFSSLNIVYVVKNKLKDEQLQLELNSDNE
jgi:rod shape-determining protein MreC